MKEWKMYQQLYNRMITDHSDDKQNFAEVISDEIVNNALEFFEVQSDVAVYPAKSYAVAIIYATLLQEQYGEDFYESLNDPDLLYGQDEHFVPYDQDPSTYDTIITKLREKENWLEGGWAPYTVNYFKLECTQEGLESINQL